MKSITAPMTMNRKGQLGFNALINLAILTLVLGLVIVITFDVLQKVFDTQDTNSRAANATNTTMEAIENSIVENIELILLVAAFAILLSFVGLFRQSAGA